MKKRFLSLFIGLALVLSFSTAVPCFADEGSTTINYMIYQYDTSTGEAMVLYADKGYPSEMGIPETIDVGGTKYTVTSIGDNAFKSCKSLKSITIPGSVKSIGEYAFGWCTGLTDITIPYSVTSIEDKVFGWCDALTDVYVPTNLSLSSGAFYQTSQPINVWRYVVL